MFLPCRRKLERGTLLCVNTEGERGFSLTSRSALLTMSFAICVGSQSTRESSFAVCRVDEIVADIHSFLRCADEIVAGTPGVTG